LEPAQALIYPFLELRIEGYRFSSQQSITWISNIPVAASFFFKLSWRIRQVQSDSRWQGSCTSSACRAGGTRGEFVNFPTMHFSQAPFCSGRTRVSFHGELITCSCFIYYPVSIREFWIWSRQVLLAVLDVPHVADQLDWALDAFFGAWTKGAMVHRDTDTASKINAANRLCGTFLPNR
jgi:hypothetical protein